MTIVNLMLRTQSLLGELHDGAMSAEQQEQLRMAMDALEFIMDIGRSPGFEQYRVDRAFKSPPLVVAAFTTHEEAKAWLEKHPDPPHHANVLIAGEYFRTVCFQDTGHRALLRSDTLAYYLADMVQEGLAAPVAAFATHDEAQAWLHGQPEPPRQVVITIAGESYLAAYHYKINLRALYPLAMAAETKQADDTVGGG
ncbi:MAG TPA: head protein [Myxococcaceae bacterium]|jgi:hypothetical protein